MLLAGHQVPSEAWDKFCLPAVFQLFKQLIIEYPFSQTIFQHTTFYSLGRIICHVEKIVQNTKERCVKQNKTSKKQTNNFQKRKSKKKKLKIMLIN